MTPSPLSVEIIHYNSGAVFPNLHFLTASVQVINCHCFFLIIFIVILRKENALTWNFKALINIVIHLTLGDGMLCQCSCALFIQFLRCHYFLPFKFIVIYAAQWHAHIIHKLLKCMKLKIFLFWNAFWNAILQLSCYQTNEVHHKSMTVFLILLHNIYHNLDQSYTIQYCNLVHFLLSDRTYSIQLSTHAAADYFTQRHSFTVLRLDIFLTFHICCFLC